MCLYHLSRDDEVQRYLAGSPPDFRPCLICEGPIGLVEKKYQQFGVCPGCAYVIVMLFADAHGDGILDVCGLAPERPRKSGKRPISASLKVRVWRRDGFKCVRCGAEDDLSCDHIIPESRGGPTEFDNLQTLCRPCNSRKGNRMEVAA